jgi:hypothetical protein
MDLHKALNKLTADCSEQILAGAHVFGLHDEDRAAVQAFMRGVNETRALKFNHPGLDTMATRSGGKLLIQNDIGTTDAHVVVVAIKNNVVTVTYTDVHLARAKFFIALFDKFAAEWSGLDRRVVSARKALSIWSRGNTRPRSPRIGPVPQRSRRGTGVLDRLEQGAQTVAQLGRQGRRRAHSRVGGPAPGRPWNT